MIPKLRVFKWCACVSVQGRRRGHDAVYVLSDGVAFLMVMDSEILRSASSVHLLIILAFKVWSVMFCSGCLVMKWSPSGVSSVLLLLSRRCSLYRSLTGRLVSPTYLSPHRPHSSSYTTFLVWHTCCSPAWHAWHLLQPDGHGVGSRADLTSVLRKVCLFVHACRLDK